VDSYHPFQKSGYVSYVPSKSTEQAISLSVKQIPLCEH
jgi:hypothetical protein